MPTFRARLQLAPVDLGLVGHAPPAPSNKKRLFEHEMSPPKLMPRLASFPIMARTSKDAADTADPCAVPPYVATRLEPGSACPLPCGVDLLPANPQGLGIESCPSRNVKRAHRDAKHPAVRAEVDEDGLVPTPAKLQLPGAPCRADSSCPCTVP
jgi:hypothetical protein